MFTFYSSVSRLLSRNKTDVVISKKPYKSVDPTVTEIKNNLEPNTLISKINTKHKQT